MMMICSSEASEGGGGGGGVNGLLHVCSHSLGKVSA